MVSDSVIMWQTFYLICSCTAMPAVRNLALIEIRWHARRMQIFLCTSWVKARNDSMRKAMLIATEKVLCLVHNIMHCLLFIWICAKKPARYHFNESYGLHWRKGPWLQYLANICHGGWMEVAKVQRGNCENQPCLLQPGKDGARGNPTPEESWFTIPHLQLKDTMCKFWLLEIVIIASILIGELVGMLNLNSGIQRFRQPLKGTELRLLLHTSAAALRPPLPLSESSWQWRHSCV